MDEEQRQSSENDNITVGGAYQKKVYWISGFRQNPTMQHRLVSSSGTINVTVLMALSYPKVLYPSLLRGLGSSPGCINL